MRQKHASLGYAAASLSALLVGLFTILNKYVMDRGSSPLAVGAWTYLAAAVALCPWALAVRGLRRPRPWVFAGWLLAGSVAGPAFYFLGLQLTSGVQGVLLINLEAVFTALLAFLFFREQVTAWTILAATAIVAGGIVISWPEDPRHLLAGHTLGNVLIAGGYLGWATENNLGRLLGETTPAVTLVCIKAAAAALAMAMLAASFHQSLIIPPRAVPPIALSGAVALGCSLALFYAAMQHIGSARTGLVASTSILWGVAAALVLLHERLTAMIVAGGLLMLLGLVLLALERPKPEQK